jgi:hypothetical protein
MKSFEKRIQKLEEQFNTKEEEKVIIVLMRHYGSKYEEIHKGICSYEKGKNCPLYKEKYEESRRNNHSGTIFISLPCFKDGECPLCMDTFPIPTSQSDQSKQKENLKNKELDKIDVPYNPIKKI